MAETRTQRQISWIITFACFAAVALILALTPGALNLAAWSRLGLRAPDWAPVFAARPLVQFHLVTVALAFALGPPLLALRKGTQLHRGLGWAWVASMGATAIASLFIRDMNDGGFSPIHLFSLMTLIGLPVGVWLARTGRRAAHARTMVGLYLGLIIAGVTAVAPGRLVWDVFFS